MDYYRKQLKKYPTLTLLSSAVVLSLISWAVYQWYSKSSSSSSSAAPPSSDAGASGGSSVKGQSWALEAARPPSAQDEVRAIPSANAHVRPRLANEQTRIDAECDNIMQMIDTQRPYYHAPQQCYEGIHKAFRTAQCFDL